jgi:hypothetical protein
MNTNGPNATAPDIEKLIQTLRLRREPRDADSADASNAFAAASIEDNLHANLASANQTCQIKPTGSGIRGFCNRFMYKLLRDMISQTNDFHAHVVRVLNKVVRVLEGEDPSISELTELHRRRISITEMLAERLAEYDAMRIDERLRALETALKNSTPPSSGK